MVGRTCGETDPEKIEAAKKRLIAECFDKPICGGCGDDIAPEPAKKCPKCGRLIWRPGDGNKRPQ